MPITKYPNVRLGTATGTITISPKGFQFQSSSQDNKSGATQQIRWVWSKIAKHQAAPPKVAKPMLKVFVTDANKAASTKAHTFTLPDRESLANINKAIQAAHPTGRAASTSASLKKKAQEQDAKLRDLERTTRDLQEQLQTQTKDHETALKEREEQYQDLSTQLDEAVQLSQRMQEELEVGQTTIAQEAEVAKLEKELLTSELEALQADLYHANEALSSRLDESEQDISEREDLSQQIQDLEEKLQEALSSAPKEEDGTEKEDLMRKIQDLEEQLQQRQEEDASQKEELVQKVQILEDQLQKQQQDQPEEKGAEKDELLQKIQDLEGKLQQQQNAENTTQKSATAPTEEQELALEALQTELQESKDELQVSQEASSKHKQELTVAQGIIEMLKQQRQDLLQKQEETKGKDESTPSSSNVKELSTEWEEERKVLVEAAAKRESELSAAQKAIKALNAQLEEIQAIPANNGEQQQSDSTRSPEEWEALQTELTQSKEELQKAQKKLDITQGLIQTLKAQSSTDTGADSSQADLDRLQSELTNAQENLQSAQEVISSNAEEQKAQQEAAVAIKNELSGEIQALKRQLLELKEEETQPLTEEGSNADDEIIQLNAKLEGCKDALKSADETLLAKEGELKSLREIATRKEEKLANDIQTLKGQLDEAFAANQVATTSSLCQGTNDRTDKNESVGNQDNTDDLKAKMKSLEAALEECTRSLEILSNENMSLKGNLQVAEAKIKAQEKGSIHAPRLKIDDETVDKGRIEKELLVQEANIEREKLAAQRAEAAFLSQQSRQSSSKSLLSSTSAHSTSKPAWVTGAIKLKGTSKGDALKSGADIHVQAFKPKPIEDMTPVEREMILRKHAALKAKKEQEKKKVVAQQEPKSDAT